MSTVKKKKMRPMAFIRKYGRIMLGSVILLTVLFPLVSLVASLPLLLLPELWSQGEYLPQLVVELLMLGIMVLLSFLLGMGYIYAPSRLPLSRRILPVRIPSKSP